MRPARDQRLAAAGLVLVGGAEGVQELVRDDHVVALCLAKIGECVDHADHPFLHADRVLEHHVLDDQAPRRAIRALRDLRHRQIADRLGAKRPQIVGVTIDGMAAGHERLAGSPAERDVSFRGYLLSRFSKAEVRLDGPLPLSVLAIFFSSLAFGLLHGAWLAGTVAGIIYALVRWRTQSTASAIYAHGITNALVFAYAAATGEWHLL
mgnify:CR=1 FL=1